MMTKKEFESEIRACLRRAELLQEAARGEIRLRAVNVKGCTVPEHKRGKYTRYIAPSGWKVKTERT